ncbi:MAG: extracellular solute-binding protein [Oscillospiraceae bacterium]|nr:extracellular solute-binding protein [Oscillospiraceae bacterium]
MLALSMLVTAGAGCGNGNSAGGTTAAATTTAAEAKADENTAAPAETTAAPDADTNTSGDKKNITVWAPDAIVDLTQSKLDTWLAGQNDWNAKYDIKVSAMGEGDAATQLLTDVEAGADIFGFAQDQLARLVAAGALSKPGGMFLDNIKNNNDAGSIGAVTLNGDIYAYPETSDNGYFLYYDKSVVSDPSTLEGIIEQCGAAGKNFYMDIQSGWYDVAFFFGTGAQCYYEYDTEGNVTGAVCDYSGDKGLAAMKAMVNMVKSKGKGYDQAPDGAASLFNPEGGTAGALVSGTWDAATVKDFLGDNYAAVKMPTFTVDGKSYQMSGFGGFKLVGVKPQTDSDKLTFCHLVADYLTSEEMQLARFEANGWGPSNKNAQQSSGVQSDAALAALADQLQYCPGQGQYPNAYWDLTKAFGTDINSGKYNDADDAALTAALKDLEDSIKAAK